MTTMVKCSRCHDWHHPADFMSNDRNVKSCKTCREKRKKSYEKHAKKRREYAKEYHEKNAERLLKQTKDYYKNQKLLYPLNTKFKQMIHSSIKSDKNSNRPYDRSDYIDEEFLNFLWDQDQLCFYCRCQMTLEFTINPNKVSIQRLDNDLPHIKTNCVLSCYSCNVNHKELIRV
jgi:hypothetical protein